MKAEVKCPACGQANEPHQLFCKYCGAKLDLSKVRFDGGPKAVVGRVIARVVRILITLALIAVLGLLLWPKPPAGAQGGTEDAERAHNKLAALHQAIQRNQALAHVFTEAEANAYLAYLMEGDDDTAGAGVPGFQVRTANLTFTADAVWVHIESAWQVITLTYDIELATMLDEGGLRVEVRRVKLGHLPVPGLLKDHFAGRVWPLFAQMERERAVLDQLSLLELEKGQVNLVVRP